MPKFDAQHPSAPEPVEFDFNPWVDAAGTIPEPTVEQLNAFLETIREVQVFSLGDDGQPRFLNKKDAATRKRRMDAAVAAVCSNTPSVEQIAKLPAAPRKAFIDYVETCFLDPEARAVGTSSSRSTGGDFGTSSAETSATP